MRDLFKVLITDRFDLEAAALLAAHSSVQVSHSQTPQPTSVELESVQGLLIRSRTKVTAEFLAQAPKLEVIVTSTSGFEHIDLAATAAQGISVMYTPDANASSAAELTWALVLACARRLNEAHRAVKTGDWKREALVGTQLGGRTYGVVGLGRIGLRVAKVAAAFGMHVVAFDPYQDEEQFSLSESQTTSAEFKAAGSVRIERLSFEELLRVSDVISFHVPATPETNRMMGLAAFEQLNENAILINTSRGSVIVEKDLIWALENSRVAACGLDVFEREPLARHSALTTFANVVLSPHLGATTSQAFAASSREAAEKVIEFVENGDVSDPLPPDTAWYKLGFSAPLRGS